MLKIAKKLLTFFILFLSLFSLGYALDIEPIREKSGWERHQLAGSVKEVVTTFYEIAEEDGELKKTMPDSVFFKPFRGRQSFNTDEIIYIASLSIGAFGAISPKERIIFNEKGKVVEKALYDKNNTPLASAHYSYEEIDNYRSRMSEILVKDGNNKNLFKTRFVYQNAYHGDITIENVTTMDFSSKTLYDTTFTLNKQGYLTHTATKQQGKEEVYAEANYHYDSHQLLGFDSSIMIEGTEPMVTRYEFSISDRGFLLEEFMTLKIHGQEATRKGVYHYTSRDEIETIEYSQDGQTHILHLKTKYDEKGNWTSQVIKMNSGPTYRYEREITYFK